MAYSIVAYGDPVLRAQTKEIEKDGDRVIRKRIITGPNSRFESTPDIHFEKFFEGPEGFHGSPLPPYAKHMKHAFKRFKRMKGKGFHVIHETWKIVEEDDKQVLYMGNRLFFRSDERITFGGPKLIHH